MTDVDKLYKRLKSDAKDYEGDNDHSLGLQDYLKELLSKDVLNHEVAKGVAKKAVNEGIELLSDAQYKALAFELLESNLYMVNCPRCGETINWGDMDIALWEGKCSTCVYQEEKIERE
ncbi:hypothetical protein MHZ96_09550 [Bacillus safensis]|uniref:hypothetical protein n=1 Tax=Bacillus safensis TaxID=561879 RepID=UPI00227E47D6|nr:hypothetical protein [Bacillus safensis]MCY7733843.1 hypothetical protein [Bacillus safensis]MEC1113656.1 hypothetical protein [Bacillus safensis]